MIYLEKTNSMGPMAQGCPGPSSRDIFSRFFCAPDFFFPARFLFPRVSGMEVPASEAIGATATDSWRVVNMNETMLSGDVRW